MTLFNFAIDSELHACDLTKLSSSYFQWNKEMQECRCPGGHALRSEWRAFKNQHSHVVHLGNCGTESAEYHSGLLPAIHQIAATEPVSHQMDNSVSKPTSLPARDNRGALTS